MSLPTSGPISFSHINTELELPSSNTISFNDIEFKKLIGIFDNSKSINLNGIRGRKNYSYTNSSSLSSVPTVSRSMSASKYGEVIALGDLLNRTVIINRYNVGSWSSPNTSETISPSVPTSGDIFGNSVSISTDGNTVVVGSPNESGVPGSVYVYNYIASSWVETKLQASDGSGQNKYGASVKLSLDKSTIIVGSPESDSVYVYKLETGTWVEKFKLVGTNTTSGDRFGNSVDISDDNGTIVIGAYAKDSQKGHIYIFEYDGSSYIEKVQMAGGNASYFFGNSVSISGDGNVISVMDRPSKSSWSIRKCSMWIYRKTDSVWNEDKKVTFDINAYVNAAGEVFTLGEEGSVVITNLMYEDPPSYREYGGWDVGGSYSGNHKISIYRYDGTSWNNSKVITTTYTDQQESVGSEFPMAVSTSGNIIFYSRGDGDLRMLD